MIPSEAIIENPQISHEVLRLPLSEVDCEKSFIAINWIYLFNLRERLRDYRSPNMLMYYRFCEVADEFHIKEVPHSSLMTLPSSYKLLIIGAQIDSLKLMRAWTDGNESVIKEYLDLNQRLKDFIALDKEDHTKKDIMRSKSMKL